MLKMICLFVIILLTSFGGMYFSAALKNRVTALKRINYMLEEIYIMLKYRSATVYEIAEALSHDERFSEFGFLREVSFSSERPFQQSWCEAVEKNIPMGINKSDSELLMNIGRQLGTSGLEGQISAVRLWQAELDPVISAAQEEYSRKAKLYRSLGVLSGVFIAIMLV